jgi:hypothetical protein
VTAAPLLPSGNVEKENTGWPEEDVAEAYGTTLPGLKPPRLKVMGGPVTGVDTPQHRIENKRRRKALLVTQSPKPSGLYTKGSLNYPPQRSYSRLIGAACAHLDLPSTSRLQNY